MVINNGACTARLAVKEISGVSTPHGHAAELGAHEYAVVINVHMRMVA
jgi:hypothetical protein